MRGRPTKSAVHCRAGSQRSDALGESPAALRLGWSGSAGAAQREDPPVIGFPPFVARAEGQHQVWAQAPIRPRPTGERPRVPERFLRQRAGGAVQPVGGRVAPAAQGEGIIMDAGVKLVCARARRNRARRASAIRCRVIRTIDPLPPAGGRGKGAGGDALVVLGVIGRATRSATRRSSRPLCSSVAECSQWRSLRR